jgi:hypothetical protein
MRISRSARDVFDQRLNARVIERKPLPLELLLRYASQCITVLVLMSLFETVCSLLANKW